MFLFDIFCLLLVCFGSLFEIFAHGLFGAHHVILRVVLVDFLPLQLATSDFENWEAVEALLDRLGIQPVDDNIFVDYLTGRRINRNTGNYAESRSESDINSSSQSTTTGPQSDTGQNVVKKMNNTSVRLSNVRGLNMVVHAFDEDSLIRFLAMKLFDGSEDLLEKCVEKAVNRLQRMRCVFQLMRITGRGHESGGLAIGEVKIQSRYILPFFTELSLGTNCMVELRDMKLHMNLSIGATDYKVRGTSDFVFRGTNGVLTEVGDSELRSLCEFKPPWGAMMAFPGESWDQAVVQALQLREMRGRACRKPAVVGITDGIASGLVIAEPRHEDDQTLGTVRIYSRCVTARSVVLRMLMLMCDVAIEELDTLSVKLEGDLIVAAAEDGASANEAGADVAPSSSASFPDGMVTGCKGNYNKPAGVGDKPEASMSYRDVSERCASCMYPLPPDRVILRPLTESNLRLHAAQMMTL